MAATLLCCALSTACGSAESDANVSSGGRDSGWTSGMGGRPEGDAAGDGGGGAGGSIGGITIEINAQAGYYSSGQFLWSGAWQWIVDQAVSDVRCSAKKVGRCRLTDCRTSKYGTDPIPVPDITLGKITFTTGTSTFTVEKPWSAPSTGAKLSGSGWQAGDTIHIQTTGGTVAPFEASLPFLGPLELIDPPLATAANDEIALDTTKPIVVKWKPTGEGQVHVYLYQLELSKLYGFDGVEAECTFDGPDGEGTFPLEVLEGFVADPNHSKKSNMWAHHAHFENTTVSGYPIQLWTGNFHDRGVTIL